LQPHAILYPGIAMFFLTFSTILALGLARYRAIQRREVSIGFFRTYDQGDQPPRLHLLARHVQNHFEVPPLFHLGLLFTFAAGAVNPVAVGFAWLFVATRCVHSYIHLGSNDVSRRFFTFGLSLLWLAGLWGTLLCSLATSAA
jgi:hypothetical protein